jgi:hypothetical protein
MEGHEKSLPFSLFVTIPSLREREITAELLIVHFKEATAVSHRGKFSSWEIISGPDANNHYVR